MARAWKAQTVPLIWESKRPDVDGLEGRIRADLQSDLDSLAKPSDLVFHIVILDELDGPTVCVFGREGSDAFHLEYSAKTEWLPLDAA